MSFINRFVVDCLGLLKLPPYLPTFYWSFLAFLFVHQVLAPYFTQRWFPDAYAALKSKASKNNWSIHVVSQVHTIVIVPLSLWCIWNERPERSSEKAFGWEDNVGYVHAIACGYFVWDTLDAIFNFIDLGFVIHGITCTLIYLMSFRPLVAYFGTRCLLWEASTFFLNIHWFLDKTNRTGTNLQLINGILLLFTFFSVRLVYGGFISYQFFVTLLEVKKEIPISFSIIFGLGNFALQGLNWLWFIKMISAIRKRFSVEARGERRKLNDHPPRSRNGAIDAGDESDRVENGIVNNS